MLSHDASGISWAVVDSGLDFLQRAVGDLASKDTKYATIHLFGAIEVLIKARLIREHWTLACKQVDGATLEAFEAGDVVTVDPLPGLKRLQNSVGLTIDKTHIDNVDAVRRLRNKVAHFLLVDADNAATRTELAKGLDFAVWFLQRHIHVGAPEREAELIDEVLEELNEALVAIQTFVTERLIRLAPILDAADVLSVCPQCSQPALELVEDTPPRCHFCEWGSQGEAGADAWVRSILGVSRYSVIKDGGTWPVHRCLACNEEAMVHGLEIVKDASRGDGDWHDLHAEIEFVCFACGYQNNRKEVEQCGRCGEWTDNGMSACDSCFDYVAGGD